MPGLVLLLGLVPSPALAWPPALEQALYRDAQRLLPHSLARLLRTREDAVLEAARPSSPDWTGLARQIASGRLEAPTLAAVDLRFREAGNLLLTRHTGAGLVRLGALLRVAADVSDPALAAEAGVLPPPVVAEYYAFIQANLDKIPVVFEDDTLRLRCEDLPAYWQALLSRSRADAPMVRDELFPMGRLVDHRTLDYRSPVFGVGSLAYSRAVNSIAATWLAGWRTVRGDMGGTQPPQRLVPFDYGDVPREVKTP
jgi:hypothetical protein